MNDNLLNEVAEMLSLKNKKDQFQNVRQTLKEMNSIVENLESVYTTADEKDIQKRLLDLTYKQTSIYEFIMNLASTNNVLLQNDKETVCDKIFEIEIIQSEKVVISTPFPPLKIGDFRSETSKIFANKIIEILEDKIAKNAFILFKNVNNCK